MRVYSVLLLASLAAAPSLNAQRPAVPPVDSTTVVLVRLTDGSQLVGRIVAGDDTSVTLLTFAGARVALPHRSISSWRPQAGRVTAGGFRRADPNTSRLFFAPTARTLPQGSGYFADYYLFFPVVAFGVTDRVMLSGGMSIIPGLSSQLFYVAGKVGVVQSPSASFAVGGFWATVPDESDASLGMGYAVTTIGSADHAVTLMAGYPFTTQDLAREPLFVVGGESRIGERSKLMAELWKLPEEGNVPALFGVRWFGDRLAVGFGFVYVLGSDTIEGWPLIPWVDFAVNW
ncbi:MAG: hypothetical protein ACREMI_12415 [Gemmatimonadales bacterium]